MFRLDVLTDPMIRIWEGHEITYDALFLIRPEDLWELGISGDDKIIQFLQEVNDLRPAFNVSNRQYYQEEIDKRIKIRDGNRCAFVLGGDIDIEAPVVGHWGDDWESYYYGDETENAYPDYEDGGIFGPRNPSYSPPPGYYSNDGYGYYSDEDFYDAPNSCIQPLTGGSAPAA